MNRPRPPCVVGLNLGNRNGENRKPKTGGEGEKRKKTENRKEAPKNQEGTANCLRCSSLFQKKHTHARACRVPTVMLLFAPLSYLKMKNSYPTSQRPTNKPPDGPASDGQFFKRWRGGVSHLPWKLITSLYARDANWPRPLRGGSLSRRGFEMAKTKNRITPGGSADAHV